jgi:hypothetical protein
VDLTHSLQTQDFVADFLQITELLSYRLCLHTVIHRLAQFKDDNVTPATDMADRLRCLTGVLQNNVLFAATSEMALESSQAYNLYDNGFQSGFPGTLEFRKAVSGVPQNIDENLLILYVCIIMFFDFIQ